MPTKPGAVLWQSAGPSDTAESIAERGWIYGLWTGKDLLVADECGFGGVRVIDGGYRMKPPSSPDRLAAMLEMAEQDNIVNPSYADACHFCGGGHGCTPECPYARSQEKPDVR